VIAIDSDFSPSLELLGYLLIEDEIRTAGEFATTDQDTPICLSDELPQGLLERPSHYRSAWYF